MKVITRPSNKSPFFTDSWRNRFDEWLASRWRREPFLRSTFYVICWSGDGENGGVYRSMAWGLNSIFSESWEADPLSHDLD